MDEEFKKGASPATKSILFLTREKGEVNKQFFNGISILLQ